MLDARRQHGDLREYALVRRAGEHAGLRPLRPQVHAGYDDGRAEVLDEMPALARDGEQVHVVAYVPEDF